VERENELTERVQHAQRKLRALTISQALEEFDGRIMGLDPDKRRAKYRKMRGSPFLFFRGSAYLFYFDVGRERFPYQGDPDRPTWIQGDLHFENFGAFRSETGRIVFDVNDFDEGCMGSYLFDVLRMSVSLFLAMPERALPEEEQKRIVSVYLSAYAKQIRRFAGREEDPRSLSFDSSSTDGPVRKLLKKTEKLAASRLIEDITVLEEERRVFRWSEEIQQPTGEERELVEKGWADYLSRLSPDEDNPDSFYRIKDIAVKHGSGTASIGLDRFYALIEGGAGHEGLDDLVIEIKEVRAPVPAYFMPYNERFWEIFAHQGKRVITTQRAMHHEADPFLGYATMLGRDFYVRERSPYKKKLKAHKLEDAKDWRKTAEVMGRITAKLHARADADMDVEGNPMDYHSEDEIARAIGDDRGAFCSYVANRAFSYACQVAEDFALFKEWSESLEGGGEE